MILKSFKHTRSSLYNLTVKEENIKIKFNAIELKSKECNNDSKRATIINIHKHSHTLTPKREREKKQ